MADLSAIKLVGDKVYVGGNFNRINSDTSYSGAAKFSYDLTLDTSFKPSVAVSSTGIYVRAIEGSPDNMIYLGGNFTTISSSSRRFLAKVSASSGALQSWDPAPRCPCRRRLKQPDRDYRKLQLGRRRNQ